MKGNIVLRKNGVISGALVLLWLGVLLSQALAQNVKEPKPTVASPEVQLTVTGKLTRVAAIGGETSGWAVVLDKPRQLGGKTLKRLELEPGSWKLEKFKNKHLEITGVWQSRTGIERGHYRVLVVKNILVLSD